MRMTGRDLIEKLNALEFAECDGIKAGDVLGGQFEYFLKRDLLRQIKDLLRLVMHLRKLKNFNYSVDIKGKPQNLVFNYGHRIDSDSKFKAVAGCIDNVVTCLEIEKYNPDYKIRRKLMYSWNKTMKSTIKSGIIRMFCCMKLYITWNMYDVLYKKCDLEKLPIKNVISGSEGYFLSSFMLQKFKYCGYKIILVQGNIANSKINKRVYLDPFDYRLVWGQAFFDDAVKNGVDANALMVVGDIASIECQRKQPREFKEVCTIGFFPDTRTFKPDAMYNYSVDLLQRFCRKNNLKLKIKIHPNLNKNNFETGLDYTVVTGIYGRECDPAVFMEQIDVAIVGNSTTLIECYSRWIPTMQIYNYDYRGTVFFDDVDLFRFSTDDELQALMDSINTPEFNAKMKRIHDYFVGDGNTRDNYINAFKKCGVL